jgi:uncharacterized protein YjbJ (UPF0337 family)
MDKEHIKGAADKAKGAVKNTTGKMMDDKGLQAEGKMAGLRARLAKRSATLRTPLGARSTSSRAAG